MRSDSQVGFGRSDACGLPQWYVLRSIPGHELCVEQLLVCKGVERYCPRYVRQVRRADHPNLARTLHPPLFPGYVLARFVWADRDYVSDTIGLLKRHPILQFGQTPAMLSEDEVQRIRIMQQNNAVPWERPITIGDRVVIHGGAFEGCEGVVQRIGNKSFFIVNIELFNRPIAAQIDSQLLRLVA